MNKMLRYYFLIAAILGLTYSQAQTVVYSDDFSTTPASFPPVGYALANGNTDATPGSNAGLQVGGSAGSIVFTPGLLSVWTTAATSPLGITNNGYAAATAPMSAVAAPFNPILSANTMRVQWAFNMQTGIPVTGFSDGRNGIAVVLAADNPDVRNAGKGYAVVFDPTTPDGISLINYSGGLLGTLSTIVATGPFMMSSIDYASVKVIYDPATDDWELQVRDDGFTSFTSPTTGTLFSVGTGTDGTYTSAVMTTFGFYGNYSVTYLTAAPDALNGYFDNFSISLLCDDIIGGLETCIGSHITLSHPIPGGTWTSFDPTTATVGSSTGIVTGISADTVTIRYAAGACLVSAIVTVDPTVIAPITGDTMLCNGDASALVNPLIGGFWFNYHTGVGSVDLFSGIYSSAGPGVDTVEYELFTGCSTIRTIRVDSVENITGSGVVCPTGTVTMSNIVVGGTWASSNTARFTVGLTSGVVTGVSVGTATLTYTTPAGCTSTFVITVNPAPSAITGDRHICVGATSALGSTPAGGTWVSSASGVATISGTGVLTGAGVGTTIITYTAIGCNVTAIATVDATPGAITGTASVCANSTTTLTPPVTGGTWTSSNTTVATVGILSGVVTGVNVLGGTATITYTLPTSGCITTQVVTVLALPASINGSLIACQGSTTTLTSATTPLNWTSSNTTVASVGATTGVVSGNALGTATITATGTNGCARSVVVTVNALPASLTGTATVCVGSSTVLSSTTTGGTWSSSTPFVAGVVTGTVTGVTAGTTNITYTVSGCSTIRTVTVNSLPSTFTGASTVCLGSSVTLSSTPTTGTWTSGNTTIATVGATTGTVNGVASGTANITYTIPNGCERVRTMTVNALPPAIGGPTTLCPGSTATLTNAATPGTWASGNTAVATIVAGTGAYTGVTSGTSAITYTQTSTGCSTTAVVTISAAPPAIITPLGDTVICPGDFVSLSVSTSPSVSYQWFSGGTPIVGATSPVLVVTASGSYSAMVSIASGCSSTSIPMSVAVTPATATITVPGGTTSTCAGTPVVLNANTGTGLSYQWELGGVAIPGANTATYNATATGSYAVRVTNATGCWAVSAAVAVTSTPIPSNTVTASGPLAICAGSSVTLTAASGAGYTYQWYDGTGAIAGATSVSYSATTAEGYYVTVTNSAGCTATSTPQAVTVNAVPSAAITPGGTRIFCIGGFVALDAAPGFQYQWYVGGVAIPGAVNATYIASASGGYRVRVTNATTGCSSITAADTVVTVISTVTAVPLTPARFCWGGSSLLSTNVSYLGTALGYQWFRNGIPVPGAVGATYSATLPGTYHCVVSVPASCAPISSSVAVTDIPLPNPVVAYNGTNAVYTGNYYVTYQWYKNLLPVTGGTSWSLPVSGDGSYKVAVTDTNGCQSMSIAYVLTGWTGPTAVTDIDAPGIRIYPSPASDYVNIDCNVNVRAVISSMDGKVLINQANAKRISLHNLANAVYIISLYTNDGQLLRTEKLVKQQ